MAASLEDVVKAIQSLEDVVSGGGSTLSATSAPGSLAASSKGGGGKGGSGGGGIPSSLKTLGGVATIGTFGKALGEGFRSFNSAGGDASSAAGGFARSVDRAASSVPFLGDLTGSRRNTGITDRTEQSISGVADNLARVGAGLSESQLRGFVGRQLEIEKRVENSRERVTNEVNRQTEDLRTENAPDLPGLAEGINVARDALSELHQQAALAAGEFAKFVRRNL